MAEQKVNTVLAADPLLQARRAYLEAGGKLLDGNELEKEMSERRGGVEYDTEGNS